MTVVSSESKQTKINQLVLEHTEPPLKRFCDNYRSFYRHRLWRPGDALDPEAVQGLQLEDAWRSSFLHKNAETLEHRNLPQAEEVCEVLESPFETTAIEDLLELSDAGEPVSWPSGLDARIAKLILKQRRLAENCNPG